ncbi:oxidation resistance protein 1 [Tilletia horrida]|uniref:Oxidation resistance protein 1 n=1 Tax=Tilletia horrida TaxID=155126 RepID=A0AAN6G9U8_9BASI|nr:oxidation resistance protein 1 [Tilletia horrida]
MSIPHYSPATGRFERSPQQQQQQQQQQAPQPAWHPSRRSDSLDSNDFGAFVDASSEPASASASSSAHAAQVAAATATAAAAAATGDEDLFHAFEQAAIEQAKRNPSPPPIDLRSVEDKLGTDILVPRRTTPSAHTQAQHPTAHSPSITRLDSSIENLANSNNTGPSSSSAFSFFDLDLLDPHHADPNRPSLDPTLLEDDPALLKEQLAIKRRQNSIAHARDYSAGAASSSAAAAASSSSLRHHGSRSFLSAGPAPVAGAPGFDPRAEKNWNTGHWKFDLEHDPVVGPGTSPLSASLSSLRSASSPASRAATLPATGSASSHDAHAAQRRSNTAQTMGSDHHSRDFSSHHPDPAHQLVLRRPITVTLTDRHELTSEVIMPWHASHLQAALPPRLRLGRTWKLLYSLDQHGMSLATLYNNVARGLDPSRARGGTGAGGASDLASGDSYMRGASAAARGAVGIGTGGGLRKVGGGLSITEAGLILAVKDADDNIFGAFINERLRPKSSYYGTGECFLWKTTRQPPSLLAINPDLEPNRIKTFRWTGRNDYVLLTEASFLSMGGGDNGRYGLWLDSSLENGVSSRCSTFGNDVLCDDEPGGEEQDGGGDLAMEREREEERKDPFGLLGGQNGVDDDGGEAKFEVMGLEVWAVGID